MADKYNLRNISGGPLLIEQPGSAPAVHLLPGAEWKNVSGDVLTNNADVKRYLRNRQLRSIAVAAQSAPAPKTKPAEEGGN